MSDRSVKWTASRVTQLRIPDRPINILSQRYYFYFEFEIDEILPFSLSNQFPKSSVVERMLFTLIWNFDETLKGLLKLNVFTRVTRCLRFGMHYFHGDIDICSSNFPEKVKCLWANENYSDLILGCLETENVRNLFHFFVFNYFFFGKKK